MLCRRCDGGYINEMQCCQACVFACNFTEIAQDIRTTVFYSISIRGAHVWGKEAKLSRKMAAESTYATTSKATEDENRGKFVVKKYNLMNL